MASEALGEIRDEATDLHQVCPTLETSAVRDAAFAGEAVAVASYRNRESAGAHYIVADGDDSDSDDEQQAVAAP